MLSLRLKENFTCKKYKPYFLLSVAALIQWLHIIIIDILLSTLDEFNSKCIMYFQIKIQGPVYNYFSKFFLFCKNKKFIWKLFDWLFLKKLFSKNNLENKK